VQRQARVEYRCCSPYLRQRGLPSPSDAAVVAGLHAPVIVALLVSSPIALVAPGARKLTWRVYRPLEPRASMTVTPPSSESEGISTACLGDTDAYGGMFSGTTEAVH